MLWQRVASLMAVLSLSLALAAGVFVSTPQAVGAQENVSQFCKEEGRALIEEEIEEILFGGLVDISISQGACVSLFTDQNPDAAINGICKSLDEEGFLEDFELTRGECKEMLHEELLTSVSELRERT